MTRRPRRLPRRKWSARRRPSRILPLGIAAGLALVALCSWWIFGPGPAKPGSTSVIIPRGHGVWALGSDLTHARVIRSGPMFAVLAEVSGSASRLKAGEYAFAARASLWQVLRAIRDGRVVRHFVTIPEGLTSRATADILDREPILIGAAPVAPEGALLPETYEVTRGESRAAVIARMERARDDLLQRLWAARPAGLPYQTPQDAVTLASVVEKETALPAERPHIAGVFLNRLQRGMRLGSDPTVIYGLTRGAPLGHGLTRTELASQSPFNTYRIAGLPPTPIDNPGRAALAAALKPDQTADLYFVANGTGGHAFAATLIQHARNVAHWRLIEHSAHQSPQAPIG